MYQLDQVDVGLQHIVVARLKQCPDKLGRRRLVRGSVQRSLEHENTGLKAESKALAKTTCQQLYGETTSATALSEGVAGCWTERDAGASA